MLNNVPVRLFHRASNIIVPVVRGTTRIIVPVVVGTTKAVTPIVKSSGKFLFPYYSQVVHEVWKTTKRMMNNEEAFHKMFDKGYDTIPLGVRFFLFFVGFRYFSFLLLNHVRIAIIHKVDWFVETSGILPVQPQLQLARI